MLYIAESVYDIRCALNKKWGLGGRMDAGPVFTTLISRNKSALVSAFFHGQQARTKARPLRQERRAARPAWAKISRDGA